MTGIGHIEWNEGMPLAVRRYGIDQKKYRSCCAVWKCTGKSVVWYCVVDRTAMTTGKKDREKKREGNKQKKKKRRKEWKKERKERYVKATVLLLPVSQVRTIPWTYKIFNSLTPHFGFPERKKTFCHLQEWASVDPFIPNTYLLWSILLNVSNILFSSIDNTLIFHSGI
jgi:hypothetical protein